jgi:hypothetical protein
LAKLLKMPSSTRRGLEHDNVVSRTRLEDGNLSNIQLQQTTGSQSQGLRKCVKGILAIADVFLAKPENAGVGLLVCPQMNIPENSRLSRTQTSLSPFGT